MRQFLENFTNKSRDNLLGLLVVLLIVFIVGCEKDSGLPGKDDVIAKYNNRLLLREEVDFFTPDSTSGEDSIQFAKKYIDFWIRLKAIEEAARIQIPELDKDLKYKLQNYESQLINHEFAEWILNGKPEMFKVSDADILNHYNRYPEKFISRTSYYQFFYLKTDLPNQYKVVNLMRSKDSEKIEELIQWAEENATEFRLDSSYVKEGELERVSKGFYYGNIRRASRSTSYPYSHTEGDTVYYDFFRMIDIIEPNEQLPLSLCKEKIVNIILNQRKNTLIEQTESNLVQQAKASNKAVIY